MYKRFLKFVPIIILLFFSCSIGNKETAVTQNKNISESFGFIHHDCLAIKNNTLKKGQIINILTPIEEKIIKRAKIKGRADATNCIILNTDNKEENSQNGLSFYKIELNGDVILSPSLAIFDESILTKKERDKILIDVNSDNVFETFNSCTTTEGIIFSIWSQRPFISEQLWSEYYYLGYDLEPSCPNL